MLGALGKRPKLVDHLHPERSLHRLCKGHKLQHLPLKLQHGIRLLSEQPEHKQTQHHEGKPRPGNRFLTFLNFASPTVGSWMGNNQMSKGHIARTSLSIRRIRIKSEAHMWPKITNQ